MRALTLIQPMAAAIVHDHPLWKDIENRPQNLPRAMRGVETTIALHAGQKWSDEYARFVETIFGIREPREWPWQADVRGALIGVMTFSGRVFENAQQAMNIGRHPRWLMGPFGYEIKERRALKTPVPCRGMQGFWPLPDDVERRVREQLA
jgi:hypothetical protein